MFFEGKRIIAIIRFLHLKEQLIWCDKYYRVLRSGVKDCLGRSLISALWKHTECPQKKGQRQVMEGSEVQTGMENAGVEVHG